MTRLKDAAEDGAKIRPSLERRSDQKHRHDTSENRQPDLPPPNQIASGKTIPEADGAAPRAEVVDVASKLKKLAKSYEDIAAQGDSLNKKLATG